MVRKCSSGATLHQQGDCDVICSLAGTGIVLSPALDFTTLQLSVASCTATEEAEIELDLAYAALDTHVDMYIQLPTRSTLQELPDNPRIV